MTDSPTPYTPTTAFSDFNPSAKPGMGTQLDVELENIATSLDETQDRLAEIQRDDGELANASVGVDQLKDEVRAGINEPAAWVTATDYSERDAVYFIVTGSTGYTKWYKCIVEHTSGVFATDLAAGYWVLVLQVDPGPTGPAGAGTASTVAPPAITTSAGAVGVSTAFAREDHAHQFSTTTQVSSLTTTQIGGLTTLQVGATGALGAVTYAGGYKPGGTQTAQFTPVVGTDYLVNCTSGGVTFGLSGMTTSQVDQSFSFASYGAYGVYLLGTVVVNGAAQTNLQLDPGASGVLRYTPIGWS